MPCATVLYAKFTVTRIFRFFPFFVLTLSTASLSLHFHHLFIDLGMLVKVPTTHVLWYLFSSIGNTHFGTSTKKNCISLLISFIFILGNITYFTYLPCYLFFNIIYGSGCVIPIVAPSKTAIFLF